MIMKKVLSAAEPYLEGRTVRDLIIGISLIACELDNGAVGVSYVLRDNLPNGCSAFPYVWNAAGRRAFEAAEWIVSGTDDLQRGIAAAVLSAASRGMDIPDDSSDPEHPFNLTIGSNDTVGMVGLIAPVAEQIKKLAGNLIVFDEGLLKHGGSPMIYPALQQDRLLPKCDIVILSGTTVINGSIDSLLSMCEKSREIVMCGASTPMFPGGWAGTGITRLAGSFWRSENKDEIFRKISLAAGIRQLGDYSIYKNIAVL